MSEAPTSRQRITTDSTTQTAKQLADQLLNVSATNLNALGNLHLPDVRLASNICRQYIYAFLPRLIPNRLYHQCGNNR